jgi:PAS domain S-box-containing protein
MPALDDPAPATVDDWRRTAQALRRAALAVAHPGGPTLFADLVAELAGCLGVAAAFVAVFKDDTRREMRALAAVLDGRPLQGFDYALAGSPCEQVVGRAFRVVADGIAPGFAPGSLFADAGIDAYAGHPLADLDGRPLGIVAVASRQPMVHVERIESMLQVFAVRAAAEIQRQRADEALRRSEASYRAIFDAAEDAVFIHDWDSGAVIDVNPKACEVYGYTREELCHADVADISASVPPYTAEDAQRWIGRARSAPVMFEWQRRNKDGSLHWDEVRLKAVTIHGRPHVLAFTREITERKAAEEALRAREEQYRAIFDGSTDAMVLWNRDIRIVDVNRAFTQMYGYARADVVGTTFGQRIPAEGVQHRVTAIRRALQGEEVQLEAETVKKDGVHFEIELRYLPIEHRGEPHVLAVGRDVTERRQALAALRSSEERYRAIFDGSVDSMVLWNRDLQVVDVNDAFVRLTGLARDEVVGRHWTQRPDADDIAQLLPHIEGALQGREVQRIERVQRADGSPFDIELRYLPVRIGDAAFALGVGRDVGERLDRERRLRDSEEQYREIFNATADALVLRDADFRIIDVNSSYERMSGYTRDEVLGLDRVLANPPEAGAAIRALHQRALAGEPIAIETELVHRDGHRYTLELRGVPTRHRGEAHVLYMGRDISDRRRAERQRSELERQLLQAQKMEAIGQLTGGIAHDFNNILTSVLGYLAMAGERAEGHADARLERQIGQATLAAQRARDLVAQMLAFARRQRGERRVLAPDALVRQAVQLLRATLPSTIELDDREVDAAVPAVDADAVQVEQVLFNLCINARDAIDGAGRIQVRLGVTEVDGDTAHGGARRPAMRLLPPAHRRRAVDRALGARHRRRHRARGAGAHVRPLLLDQGGRPRLGHGAGDGARHRARPRRPPARADTARRRHPDARAAAAGVHGGAAGRRRGGRRTGRHGTAARARDGGRGRADGRRIHGRAARRLGARGAAAARPAAGRGLAGRRRAAARAADHRPDDAAPDRARAGAAGARAAAGAADRALHRQRRRSGGRGSSAGRRAGRAAQAGDADRAARRAAAAAATRFDGLSVSARRRGRRLADTRSIHIAHGATQGGYRRLRHCRHRSLPGRHGRPHREQGARHDRHPQAHAPAAPPHAADDAGDLGLSAGHPAQAEAGDRAGRPHPGRHRPIVGAAGPPAGAAAVLTVPKPRSGTGALPLPDGHLEAQPLPRLHVTPHAGDPRSAP